MNTVQDDLCSYVSYMKVYITDVLAWSLVVMGLYVECKVMVSFDSLVSVIQCITHVQIVIPLS